MTDTTTQTVHHFPNGYGAVVYEGPGAYEGSEFTVTYRGRYVYDTPVEEERGWWHVSEAKLAEILDRIAALPARN